LEVRNITGSKVNVVKTNTWARHGIKTYEKSR
jgi:hypothetical protein